MGDTIPHDKWFYFKHGRRASSIQELKEILDNIEEGEFRHHVNNEKNDFASWVEDVFGEEKLAHNMREVNDKEGIIIILDDFLNSQKEVPIPPEPQLTLPAPEVPSLPEHIVHHRRHKEAVVPEEKKLNLEPEKELSEKEIKNIVDEAMQVFEKREKKKDEKEEEENKEEDKEEEKEEAEEPDEVEEDEEAWEKKFKAKLDSEKSKPEKQQKYEKEHHKFIVEEFLYGFILGLIFGLIMLGVILHLNIA